MKRGDFLLRLNQLQELVQVLRTRRHLFQEPVEVAFLDEIENMGTGLLIETLEMLDNSTYNTFWCLANSNSANCAVVEATNDIGHTIATAWWPSSEEADVVAGGNDPLFDATLGWLGGEL